MFRPASLAILLAVASCSAPGPKLSAQDAWARETDSGNVAAAYLTISNEGGADRLVGVRASIGGATLHESSLEDGVARMRPVAADEGLVVPSNGRLLLAPGGAHVMITGLDRPLRAGDRFRLTLLFDETAPKQVAVEVRPAGQ